MCFFVENLGDIEVQNKGEIAFSAAKVDDFKGILVILGKNIVYLLGKSANLTEFVIL